MSQIRLFLIPSLMLRGGAGGGVGQMMGKHMELSDKPHRGEMCSPNWTSLLMAHSLSSPGKTSARVLASGIDLMPYLFILPAVVIYVVFNLGPVLASFVLSFFKLGLC